MATRPRRSPRYTIKFECPVEAKADIEKLTPKEWSLIFVELPESYSAVLAAAQTLVESAAGEVESLHDEIQDWHENLPDSFKDGDKGSELEECATQLEEIKDTLERVDFDDVKLEELGDDRKPTKLAVVARMEASTIASAKKRSHDVYGTITPHAIVQLISTDSKSRADRLEDAMSDVEEAKQLLETLEEKLAEEQVRQTEDSDLATKFMRAGEAVHELAEALAEVDGSNVSFPGMY